MPGYIIVCEEHSMTTLAYRDGALAADHSVSVGDTIFISNAPKVVRREGGDLAGASGSLVYNNEFLQWFSSGEKGQRPTGLKNDHSLDRGIIIRAKDRSIEIYEESSLAARIETAYYACGSGIDIALGALHHGATAEEAVQAAVAHNAYTRLPITVVYHDYA